MSRADRSGQLQDWRLQSLAERQGLFNGVQATWIQPGHEHERGAMQAEDW